MHIPNEKYIYIKKKNGKQYATLHVASIAMLFAWMTWRFAVRFVLYTFI